MNKNKNNILKLVFYQYPICLNDIKNWEMQMWKMIDVKVYEPLTGVFVYHLCEDHPSETLICLPYNIDQSQQYSIYKISNIICNFQIKSISKNLISDILFVTYGSVNEEVIANITSLIKYKDKLKERINAHVSKRQK